MNPPTSPILDDVGSIQTERMELVPASAELLRSELLGDLETALGVTVATEWPPELYDAEAIHWTLEQMSRVGESAWWFHYFVARDLTDGPMVIGAGGYKGPPADGVVEIGYSIVASHQRRGYASEATSGLVEAAFARGASTVIAETLPDLVGSIRVLENCGFEFVGEGSESGVIRYLRSQPAS